jgi:hypothetical protein
VIRGSRPTPSLSHSPHLFSVDDPATIHRASPPCTARRDELQLAGALPDVVVVGRVVDVVVGARALETDSVVGVVEGG